MANDPSAPPPAGGPRRSWRDSPFRKIDDSEAADGWKSVRAMRKAKQTLRPTGNLAQEFASRPLVWILGALIVAAFYFARRWNLF